MGTPTNRTPVRVARGSTTALNTGLSDIQEGEIVWDTTLNKLQVKEGSALEDHTVDTSTLAPLAGATFTGDVKLGDGDYLKLGDSDDLSVHHVAGGGTFIVNNAALYTRGTELFFQEEGDSNKEWIHCLPGGSVELSYDDSKKFETTTDGAKVTGDLEVTSNIHLGSANIIYFGDGANDDFNPGSYQMYENTDLYLKSNAGHMRHQAAAGQSVLLEGPTGSLAKFIEGGACELYHDDVKKFETTSSGVKVTGAAVPASITALTDGATIATDLALNNNYSVTLAGNRTLGQPTNQVVGQSGSIFITQDGTGSRILSYHADWKWAGGSANAPTLSTAAASVDRIDYIVAAANKIHAVATLAVA